MKDSQGKIFYTYDGRNRLSSVRYDNGRVMTYRYDPVGNLIACNVYSHNEAVVIDSSPPPSPQPVQTVATPSTCPGCGKPVTPGKKFCSACGATVSAPAPAAPVTAAPPPSSVCAACGNPIKPGAKFCAKCGRRRT